MSDNASTSELSAVNLLLTERLKILGKRTKTHPKQDSDNRPPLVKRDENDQRGTHTMISQALDSAVDDFRFRLLGALRHKRKTPQS